VVTDCSFQGNTAAGGAGGGLYFAYCSDKDCSFLGFGDDSSGFLEVVASNFTRNTGTGGGGGLAIRALAQAVVRRSLVVGNFADTDGGGLSHQGLGSGNTSYSDSSVGLLDLIDCRIEGNTAANGDGGGVAVLGGALNAQNVSFVGNFAANGSGGGLAVAGFPEGSATRDWFVRSCTFTANLAGNSGGGLYSGTISYQLQYLAGGGGVPFALRDEDVLCRGRGVDTDLDVVRHQLPLVAGAISTAASDREGTVGQTILAGSSVQDFAADGDALPVGLAADGAVAVLYRNWEFELVAVTVPDGRTLARFSAPVVAEYTAFYEVTNHSFHFSYPAPCDACRPGFAATSCTDATGPA
jgi:predicted outer membrane repeat protein